EFLRLGLLVAQDAELVQDRRVRRDVERRRQHRVRILASARLPSRPWPPGPRPPRRTGAEARRARLAGTPRRCSFGRCATASRRAPTAATSSRSTSAGRWASRWGAPPPPPTPPPLPPPFPPPPPP